MCGIALICSPVCGEPRQSTNHVSSTPKCLYGSSIEAPPQIDLLTGLRARGPDYLGTHEVVTTCHSGGEAFHLRFAASLLQLRGTHHGTSPCISAEGHVLCFNGEVFGGLHVPSGANDGTCLLEALTAAGSSVPEVISSLRGPWALMFWDPHRQQLWLGRDVMGRRSMLIHPPDDVDHRLLLTSVSELSGSRPTIASASATATTIAPATTCAATATAIATAAVAPSDTDPHTSCPVPPCSRLSTSAAASHPAGEDQEAEPQASDGFWTELPPGLYSISFMAPAATTSVAERIEEGLGAPYGDQRLVVVDSEEAAQAGVKEAGREVWRRVVLGGVELSLVRHSWQHPFLADLESYNRLESVVTVGMEVADGGGGGEREGVADGVGDGGGGGRTGESPIMKGAKPSQQPGKEEKEEGRDAGGAGPSPTLFQVPGAVVEAAAQAVLNTLLAAVRVRCACIQTRSPHPAASYALAATAAATATASSPQPSWRSDRNLDFRTPLGMRDRSFPCDNTVPIPKEECSALGSSPLQADVVTGDGAVGRHWVATPQAAPHLVEGQGAVGGAAPTPPIMILFSGGVDSVLLAALAHRALPLEVPIDLSNVCFARGSSPDREAARAALQELAVACPGRCWRLIEVDARLEDVDRHRARLLALLRPAGTVMDLNIGAALWLAVAGQGTLRLPAAVGPTVAAINTAAASISDPDASTTTPSELQETSRLDAKSAHSNCTTTTTTSRHYAVPAEGSLYGSAARVVLLGHGADEQCGGYGRHRTRFRSGSWSALAGELEVDVRRLWLRNLGRDDRLVADWGREARHPFLDEDFMHVVLRTDLRSILDLSLPPGQGDKKVLRRALQLLGLPQTAERVKRAIQFGSRIGKVSNRRDFGSNRAANRKNAGGVALQDVGRSAADAAATAWVKPGKVDKK